jgi:hypothetical protein
MFSSSCSCLSVKIVRALRVFLPPPPPLDSPLGVSGAEERGEELRASRGESPLVASNGLTLANSRRFPVPEKKIKWASSDHQIIMDRGAQSEVMNEV